MTKESDELIATFERLVSGSVDEQGVFPFPCVSRDASGGLIIGALALKPPQAMRYFWGLVAKGSSEIVLGMDHYTKPGQGTELGDMVSVLHWRRDLGPTFQAQRRIGVIEYQNSPRIVRPINWSNPHWTKIITNMALECAR